MDKLDRFIQYIKESDNIVFFGGAGVSTESGIPDFRSKDGLYNQKDVQFDKFSPEYLLSNGCLLNTPKVFYEFYRQKLDTRNVQPNITHKALAYLEEIGKLSAVITQNIDGLHQKAGSKNVYEIHGTTQKNYCMRCHKEYPESYLFESSEDIPKCKESGCRGKIRPKVTLYGEELPMEVVKGAVEAIQNADMLIIGGTSLTVYPANTYISEFHGKHLVVINKETLNVPITDEDIVFNDSLGEVFGAVMEKIK